MYVGEGTAVKQVDVIGAVGSTGNATVPHLHLEVRLNGTALNPQYYVYK
jgi:murein DD-endopeptidase MepM/ murein hydrolase activator NlpD